MLVDDTCRCSSCVKRHDPSHPSYEPQDEVGRYQRRIADLERERDFWMIRWVDTDASLTDAMRFIRSLIVHGDFHA